MNMLTNLLFRNHFLLRWEGSHPSASIKFQFCITKVEVAQSDQSPAKRARLAVDDPYAGAGPKVEEHSQELVPVGDEVAQHAPQICIGAANEEEGAAASDPH